MRKNYVKTMASALVATLLLSGCGASGEQKTATGTQSAGNDSKTEFQSDANLNEPGMEPIAKERVTIKVVTDFENIDESFFVKQAQERLGIDFEWISVPKDQFKEKVNLMLSSGDSIDLILRPNMAGATMTKTEEYKLAQQGLITPLNDYIENSSKYMKEYYDAHPYYYQETTTPDGNIYSIQEHNMAYHVTMPYKMWINTAWLDNLNLEMPKTTEEFYQVLKAFKEQDANGNGDPNDEIPLTTCTNSALGQVDGFIMNAFTLNEPENMNAKRMRISDDGKVEAAFVDEDYREGLRYLNRLYNEGLLYSDSFTQDRKTMQALNEAGDATRIGCIPSQHMGSLVASMTETDRWQEYEILEPLEGPEGLKVTPRVHPANSCFTPNGLIPATAQNPEAAFRLLDMMFSEEWAYMAYFGEEGVDWRAAEDGELGANGEPALITRLGTSSDRKNKLENLIPKLEIPHTEVTCEQDPKASDAQGHEFILYQATEKISAYASDEKNMLPVLYYLPEENEKIATYAAVIDPYVNESIARFVTGDLDLEKDWENYLKELDSFGLPDYVSTIQSGYDRWVSNAK